MKKLIFLLTVFSLHSGVRAQNEPTLTVSPNPFVDTTTITFTLPFTDTVSLAVYTQFGELIDSLIKEQVVSAGTQSIQFIGDTLPVGQYFAFLDVDTHLLSQKFSKIGQLTISLDDMPGPGLSPLNIYPNPTTGQITLMNLPQEPTRIIVYNILGELVYEQSLADPQINISEFPQGVYFLIVNINGKIRKNKIIKITI